MKKTLATICAGALALSAAADVVKVETFSHYGPYPVKSPVIIDSLDVKAKKASLASWIGKEKKVVLPSAVPSAWSAEVAPASSGEPEVNFLVFGIDNRNYADAKLNISGLNDFVVYADGNKIDRYDLSLSPASHEIVIKYLAMPERADSLKVEIESERLDKLTVTNGGKKMLTLDGMLHGTFLNGANISPDGKFALVRESTVVPGGKTSSVTYLRNLSDSTSVAISSKNPVWMPQGSRYYFTRQGLEGTQLIAVDAATGKEETLANNLPEGYYTVTPDEKRLIVSVTQEGPKEEGVHEILEPEDRQPGWRNRGALAIYELATGMTTPLTHGHRNVYLTDISSDSKKALIMVQQTRLEKRPTTVFSLYELDLDTYGMAPLVEMDGFISSAVYSPDGEAVLVSGSPEALGGIGKNVPKGKIPNMTEGELFLISLTDGSKRALTRDFNPSVKSSVWNKKDGKVYFTAENRDYVSLYRLDPYTGTIEAIETPEDVVMRYSIADNAPEALYIAQSATNPDRLYRLDLTSLQSTLLEAPRDPFFENLTMAECHPWEFKNSREDTIYGRFYLPPNFDPKKKYPLIVNYYGGCSPTSRNFDTRYPHNVYANLGYVVLVLNPSGATGFGQEFGSRHVNTAGKGVADDIIEGTKTFCKQHPYINDKKIGCIGASYGGFMTQYLQTVSDIFAAAISHAGISDHTSYWGNGYWGYSYSEVSMAESYPWTNPDLYVKQSPLYNAQKINTPLLFVHGTADTNVPLAESVQLFTALKLLGKETALVEVDGEDHWIMDYDKRHKWQDTIFAWFAKWLQDDSSWWEQLYPEKQL